GVAVALSGQTASRTGGEGGRSLAPRAANWSGGGIAPYQGDARCRPLAVHGWTNRDTAVTMASSPLIDRSSAAGAKYGPVRAGRSCRQVVANHADVIVVTLQNRPVHPTGSGPPEFDHLGGEGRQVRCDDVRLRQSRHE